MTHYMTDIPGLHSKSTATLKLEALEVLNELSDNQNPAHAPVIQDIYDKYMEEIQRRADNFNSA